MEITKVTTVTFSPTNQTAKYAKQLAELFDKPVVEKNRTSSMARSIPLTFQQNELVILGFPVYYGRLPIISEEFFATIQGDRTPVILLGVYGNRHYDDSLLEMKHLAESKGFVPIAAGAFIGKHTYSEFLGCNRPNEEDYALLKELAEKVMAKLESDDFSVEIPGNDPYKTFQIPPFAPSTNEDCIFCTACQIECPVGAISPTDPADIDGEKCIICTRCMVVCPTKAKSIENEDFKVHFKQIEENNKEPKAAELFL